MKLLKNTLIIGCIALAMASSYMIGYGDGGDAGYKAGVAQDRLYQRGHAMAADWHTYSQTRHW